MILQVIGPKQNYFMAKVIKFVPWSNTLTALWKILWKIISEYDSKDSILIYVIHNNNNNKWLSNI